MPAAVLALGDPTFGQESASPEAAEFRSSFAENGGLGRLPASADEARLAGHFGRNSRWLVGTKASESALKAALADTTFGVLHLATHAIVDDWTPARTALALAPDASDDGFLSPGEILSLRIPAELVVLSACRTAAGPVVTGEGVQGLTAPLLAAGARSVVATHWPIRDQVTLPFVRVLYRSLAAGQTVGDALQSAKLDAIARGRPVSEWAAFLAVGDPMLRLDLPEPRDRRPALVTGLFVAAGVLGLAFRAGWRRRVRA
jgi:CHAT domain-containing protein